MIKADSQAISEARQTKNQRAKPSGFFGRSYFVYFFLRLSRISATVPPETSSRATQTR